MKRPAHPRSLAPSALAIVTAWLGGCGEGGIEMYGRSSVPPAPTALDTFNTNCAGCHGTDGAGAAARALADARWWATISDAEILAACTHGQGVMMPVLTISGGGMIPDATLEGAIPAWRAMWGEGSSAAPQGWAVQRGDATRGAKVFEAVCATCHPAGAAGGITDPTYLALVSDQALWSGVVFGRPDLGKAGLDLPRQGVADVVAWLASQRPSWAALPPGVNAP